MFRGRPAIALLFVLAAACGGGEDASALDPGDYFTQVERISQNAHTQERGLARDLRVRMERAIPGAERLGVVEVYLGQSARLYQDVVDALADLQPEDGLEGLHDAYVGAWQAKLDLILSVRDAGFPAAIPYLRQLELPAFDDADAATRARCEDLQRALTAAGREVDLACGGPS